MIPREILTTYLKDAIELQGEPAVRPLFTASEDGGLNLMAKARQALPAAFADRLVNEYRAVCGANNDLELNEYLSMTKPSEWDKVDFIEGVIDRLNARAPLKDARAQVTFFAETNTCRVVVDCQGYGFSEVTCHTADQLWKLLQRAATDGIDIPAPKPIPYRVETAEEWLKTHRPTKAAIRKMVSTGQLPAAGKPRAAKKSMSLDEIMKLDIKL
jgi:hypothetical protein